MSEQEHLLLRIGPEQHSEPLLKYKKYVHLYGFTWYDDHMWKCL